MLRDLQPHEALIVAVNEICGKPEISGMGAKTENLMQPPLTKGVGERDMDWAIKRARVDGWLMDDDLLGQTIDGKWHGLRLSNVGLDKVAELTKPWWRGLVGALVGDTRTVLVAAITAVTSAVVTTLILSLLD